MYVLSYTHRGLLRRSTTWHLISSSSIADALARYAALAEFSADKVLCRIYSSARFSYSFCHYMHNALKFVVGCIVALFLQCCLLLAMVVCTYHSVVWDRNYLVGNRNSLWRMYLRKKQGMTQLPFNEALLMFAKHLLVTTICDIWYKIHQTIYFWRFKTSLF